MPSCLIGLGSNLGRREETLSAAWSALGAISGIETSVLSRFYATRPVGGPPQPDFLNAAGMLETSLEPDALLDALLSVENRFGRVRTVRWGPRTLDLDLLLYGERVIRTERLSVPHPLMTRRRFVLEPAAEIAPNRLHPLEGRTLGELFAALRQEESSLSSINDKNS